MSSLRQLASACVSMRQHVSAYVSIRQHTLAYVSISIRQQLLTYANAWRNEQHTSAYVSICCAMSIVPGKICLHQALHETAHSIRQHTSAYISIVPCNICVHQALHETAVGTKADKASSKADKPSSKADNTKPLSPAARKYVSGGSTLYQPHVHARAHVTFVAGTPMLRVLRSCRMRPGVLVPVDRTVYDTTTGIALIVLQ
jgi:hypothetical protein